MTKQTKEVVTYLAQPGMKPRKIFTVVTKPKTKESWEKKFDEKYQYSLDDGFYVIEQKALKQFISQETKRAWTDGFKKGQTKGALDKEWGQIWRKKLKEKSRQYRSDVESLVYSSSKADLDWKADFVEELLEELEEKV